MFILVKSQMQMREARDAYPSAVLLWRYQARQNRILIPLIQERLAKQLGVIFKTSVLKAHHEPYWLIRLKVSQISMEQIIQLLRDNQIIEEDEPQVWKVIIAQEKFMKRLAREP